ncbi:hypothetical protein GCM10010174_82510 [Kutzneria viridogrisea]
MTFDDVSDSAQPPAVTITGTRSARMTPVLAQAFATYLRPFALPDTRFYLGGAVGIDSHALLWLAEHTDSSLIVVAPSTMADQPAEARDAVDRAAEAGRLTNVVELGAPRLGTAAYHARNRWMVDRSGLVIGFPAGTARTSGTWYTLDYAAERGMPHVVVPVDSSEGGVLKP